MLQILHILNFLPFIRINNLPSQTVCLFLALKSVKLIMFTDHEAYIFKILIDLFWVNVIELMFEQIVKKLFGMISE